MIILIVLCVVGAVGCKMWLSSYVGQELLIPFLGVEDVSNIDPSTEGFIAFWTFVIILQVMIPLSLYVTIELCKIMQVYHIHNNVELYDSQTNKRTECRAMNITEELGQVQYIFSDKTGTLTENKMIFRRCAIAGVDYNHPETEEEKELPLGGPAPILIPNINLLENLNLMNEHGRYTPIAEHVQEFFLVLTLCNTVVVSPTPHKDVMNASGVIEMTDNESNVTIVKPVDGLVNGDSGDRYSRLTESRSITPSPPLNGPSSLPLKQHHVPSLSPISSSAETTPISESPPMRVKSNTPTARVISIVSKIPKLKSSSSKNKLNMASLKGKFHKSASQVSTPDGRPIFEAESPDELALVNAAYSYDCCLVNRSPNHVLVSMPGQGVMEYEVLKILPFDSHRKCMSIVVRRVGTQDVILYTKGADSTIMVNLTPCLTGSDEHRLREQTQHQLNMYAKEGLRVLVMAKRSLDPQDFSEWYMKHQECELSLENREKKVRESFGLLERNLTLMGTTGIEDRLQHLCLRVLLFGY